RHARARGRVRARRGRGRGRRRAPVAGDGRRRRRGGDARRAVVARRQSARRRLGRPRRRADRHHAGGEPGPAARSPAPRQGRADTTPVAGAVRPPDLPPQAMAEPKRRRVTWRSVLFVAAILAILGIAFGAITYYGRSGYYVGFVGDQVAVFKGQKGGVLWVKPTLHGTYPLHRADLTAAWQQRLDDTITFTSRASADAWFDTLEANPAAVPGL